MEVGEGISCLYNWICWPDSPTVLCPIGYHVSCPELCTSCSKGPGQSLLASVFTLGSAAGPRRKRPRDGGSQGRAGCVWKSLAGSRREGCLPRTERRSSGKQDSGAWKTEPQAPLTAEISCLFVSEGRAWLPLPSIWTAGQQQVRATAPLLPPLLALRSSRQMATASGLGHGVCTRVRQLLCWAPWPGWRVGGRGSGSACQQV